jgi:ATP/maltotriose-dependent transcriptional regulator MalT
VGLDAVGASVLHRLATALFALGEYERAEEMAERAIEAAGEHGTADDVGAAYANIAEALAYAGRDRQALELLERAPAELPAATRTRRWLDVGRADLAFLRGDWEAAARYMPADAGRLEGGTTLADADLRHAQLALGRGELEQARAALDEVDRLIVAAVEPQYLALATALRAELELREGDPEGARKTVEDGLDRLQFCTDDLARLALVAATGVAVEATAAERARDLGDAAALDSALDRARTMLARVEAAVEDAPHPIELAQLATARAHMARAQADPGAAELWRESAATWRALERPYPAAVAGWREAEAWLAGGEREHAATAAAAALLEAERLGAAWLCAELEALGARARLSLRAAPAADDAAPDVAERPFGLTERELQVLTLLATGATNREIGEELFMAEKTASVHVSRILGKLDVRSRTEAAAVAHRQGLAPAPRA